MVKKLIILTCVAKLIFMIDIDGDVPFFKNILHYTQVVRINGHKQNCVVTGIDQAQVCILFFGEVHDEGVVPSFYGYEYGWLTEIIGDVDVTFSLLNEILQYCQMTMIA